MTFQELSSLGLHMRRRNFITLLSGAAASAFAASAPAARADPARRRADAQAGSWRSQRRRLHYARIPAPRLKEGQNFHIEYRAVSPKEDELGSAAADLVGMRPE